MSDKKDKKAAKAAAGDADEAKKKKKGEKHAGQEAGGGTVFSVANHPRAKRSVREIKAGVGLAGFIVALVLSLQAGVPLAIAAERALMLGIAGYLVAWGCAVWVWRALLTAQLKAEVEAITLAREEAAAASRAGTPAKVSAR